MEGYIIFSESGDEILELKGDCIKIYEDRTEIFLKHVLVAVVPKSMLIIRGDD